MPPSAASTSAVTRGVLEQRHDHPFFGGSTSSAAAVTPATPALSHLCPTYRFSLDVAHSSRDPAGAAGSTVIDDAHLMGKVDLKDWSPLVAVRDDAGSGVTVRIMAPREGSELARRGYDHATYLLFVEGSAALAAYNPSVVMCSSTAGRMTADLRMPRAVSDDYIKAAEQALPPLLAIDHRAVFPRRELPCGSTLAEKMMQ